MPQSIFSDEITCYTINFGGQDIHPMDCTDMVIGMAKNGRGFVADYYTRDRSTPRRDAFWVRQLGFHCNEVPRVPMIPN
jgi:hypothetical protein